MVDVARVNLYGMPIGSVRWDQRYEIAQFEYDPDFVRQGIEPSPLMMPVREGRVYSFGELDKTTFKGLPGMLADSLPDTYVTGNQEYIKIGNEATSKIATIVHQKR